MDTIIVKPANDGQWKEVMDFLKRLKVKSEVCKEPSKEQVLGSVEKGAGEAAEFIKGKRILRNVKELLSEL